jgi:methyl-accepting chemotaxis protein
MELAKGNEGMLVSVSAIGDAAKKASAACQEMASGAEEQAASAQEIAASAEALAKLGQEMQNVVGQFRE